MLTDHFNKQIFFLIAENAFLFYFFYLKNVFTGVNLKLWHLLKKQNDHNRTLVEDHLSNLCPTAHIPI
jgi:hypothetical protein